MRNSQAELPFIHEMRVDLYFNSKFYNNRIQHNDSFSTIERATGVRLRIALILTGTVPPI